MAKGYRFCNPESSEDYNQLYNVMNSVFRDEDVAGIVRRFVEYNPEMTKENYFIIKHGDTAVAGLVLIPQTWIIDDVELKVAEMGCVGTVPDHRHKGIQWILNNKFDEYAKEHQFDLTALAGIPYFYRQFGYQYALELDYLTTIDIEKLSNNNNLKYRPFKNSDISESQKILEQIQKKYLIKSLRTLQTWKIQQKTGTYGAEPFKGTVILAEDKLVAYYRWSIEADGETLLIKELAKSQGVSSREVGAAIRFEAEKLGLKKIKTKLSHLDDFSHYLIKQGAETNNPYAWQVKILDLRRFFLKIGPVLERRLEESVFKGFTEELQINFWKYALSLKFKDGKLLEVEEVDYSGRSIGINPYASIQLFLGYRSRRDLGYAYPDFIVRDGYENLIDVLFPRKPSYIHYSY